MRVMWDTHKPHVSHTIISKLPHTFSKVSCLEHIYQDQVPAVKLRGMYQHVAMYLNTYVAGKKFSLLDIYFISSFSYDLNLQLPFNANYIE